MSNMQLPSNATSLSDHADRRPPVKDDDAAAALRLIKDAIMLHDTGAFTTAIQRGSYEVSIIDAPDNWDDEYVLHLLCITNTVVPDPTEPGTTAQTFVTLWVESLAVAREMVVDHCGAEAFEDFTSREEAGY